MEVKHKRCQKRLKVYAHSCEEYRKIPFIRRVLQTKQGSCFGLESEGASYNRGFPEKD